MKICTKCEIEKEDDDFYFRNKSKGIRHSECILCIKSRANSYYEENSERAIEVVKLYRMNYADKINQNKKEYYKENKVSIKAYQIENKDRIQKSQNEQRKKRRANDPSFRLRTYVSNSIRDVLKGRKDGHTWKNLPYSSQELKIHLEKQFESWMTWENHGKYDPKVWDDNNPTTWTWQIDHIIPQSDLLYDSVFDTNFQKCWALSNLRPLSAKQNIVEGSNRARHK